MQAILEFSFNKMVYSIKEMPVHIKNKSSMHSILITGMGAGFAGLAIAKYVSHNLADDYRLIIFFIALVLISYFFIGYMLLIQLYTTWIVYKRTKREGSKMTIKEFA